MSSAKEKIDRYAHFALVQATATSTLTSRAIAINDVAWLAVRQKITPNYLVRIGYDESVEYLHSMAVLAEASGGASCVPGEREKRSSLARRWRRIRTQAIRTALFLWPRRADSTEEAGTLAEAILLGLAYPSWNFEWTIRELCSGDLARGLAQHYLPADIADPTGYRGVASVASMVAGGTWVFSEAIDPRRATLWGNVLSWVKSDIEVHGRNGRTGGPINSRGRDRYMRLCKLAHDGRIMRLYEAADGLHAVLNPERCPDGPLEIHAASSTDLIYQLEGR